MHSYVSVYKQMFTLFEVYDVYGDHYCGGDDGGNCVGYKGNYYIAVAYIGIGGYDRNVAYLGNHGNSRVCGIQIGYELGTALTELEKLRASVEAESGISCGEYAHNYVDSLKTGVKGVHPIRINAHGEISCSGYILYRSDNATNGTEYQKDICQYLEPSHRELGLQGSRTVRQRILLLKVLGRGNGCGTLSRCKPHSGQKRSFSDI